MIVNLTKPQTFNLDTQIRLMKVLDALRTAPFRCYLTGSRFFNLAGCNNGDWDFFTQCTHEVKAWMELNDFGLLAKHRYIDSLTIDVYRYNAGTGSNEWIDVQLVSNAKVKALAQLIAVHPPMGYAEWDELFVKAARVLEEMEK